ncbi:hypothetical protein LEMLEM_LOCUS8086 [Lemmus lemmus]
MVIFKIFISLTTGNSSVDRCLKLGNSGRPQCICENFLISH